MTTASKPAELAMGRIFGMLQRPYKDGDEIEYARCRNIILDIIGDTVTDTEHSFARDYRSILMSGQAS